MDASHCICTCLLTPLLPRGDSPPPLSSLCLYLFMKKLACCKKHFYYQESFYLNLLSIIKKALSSCTCTFTLLLCLSFHFRQNNVSGSDQGAGSSPPHPFLPSCWKIFKHHTRLHTAFCLLTFSMLLLKKEGKGFACGMVQKWEKEGRRGERREEGRRRRRKEEKERRRKEANFCILQKLFESM